MRAGSDRVAQVAEQRGLRIFSVGRAGADISLKNVTYDGFGQRLQLVCGGKDFDAFLPLAGSFQCANALIAAGLAMVTGGETEVVIEAISGLEGAVGRLEDVASTPEGARVFIDYAHTPDALGNAIDALRPFAKGRLIVVFGCGGDRDRGKRPQMGRIAEEKADMVYVTDDNPGGAKIPPTSARLSSRQRQMRSRSETGNRRSLRPLPRPGAMTSSSSPAKGMSRDR